MSKYTVIRDTSEKENHGWWFPPDDRCMGTIRSSLDTGDYTLLGYENTFTIERKRTTGEVAINIYEKRFIAELERLTQFKHPFIIMEFSMNDVFSFPLNSGIPKNRWKYLKTESKALLKHIMDYQVKYGIPIIFAGDFGEEVATSLFKRITEHVETNNP